MINSIPMNMLDHVKDWLNSCEVHYTEGIQSLNWAKIMKTITDDPEGFFDNGGWSFLEPESADEGGDDDDDEDDEAYTPTDIDSEEGDSSEDYSEESDWSGEAEDSSEEELGSSEESGKDWDELEEEARRADAETLYDEMEGSKHKPPAPSSSSRHKHHSSSSSSRHKSSHKSPHKSPHKSSHKSSHKSPHKSDHKRKREDSGDRHKEKKRKK